MSAASSGERGGPGWTGRAQLAALRLAPRHALTHIAGIAAGWTRPRFLARLAVAAFARRYRLDLTEAEEPLDRYGSVRALFTRRLRPGLRPVAPGDSIAVCPADGVLSMVGESTGGWLTQIKGIDYALSALLADDRLAEALVGGSYATIYLSPQHYHRVHAPLEGELRAVSYVPGDLWPVNALSVASVSGLFTVNERLVFELATAVGPVAVVMVGATVVGRLRATCVDPEPFADRSAARISPQGLTLVKGQEIGIFDMGSTVVICFAPGGPRRLPLAPGASVTMGQPLAVALPSADDASR